jgi:hypothetical protein
MLTDKPPVELSPLEELCLHFLIRVRGIRSGMMEYPVRRKPRRGHRVGTAGIAAAVPVTIEAIAASAEDQIAGVLRMPFLGEHAWQGITAEAKFIAATFAHKIGLSIPYGGGYVPFDLILFTRLHNYRVQVKYGSYERFASWMVQVRRRGNIDPYKEGDFDILAATGPDGVWYLIPFAALKGRKSLHIPRRARLRDTKPGFPIQKWRERWDLFK